MKKITFSPIWIFSTGIIAFLVLITSYAGIFDPKVYIKETANWTLQARGQDIGNLIAIPILFMGCYLMTKGSIKGYLLWIGSLMYFLYAYIIYSFFIHFNYLFLGYIAVLGLSFYTIYHAIKDHEKNFKIKASPLISLISGTVLIVTGSLFSFLWLSEIIPALLTGGVLGSLKDTGLWINPVQVIDLAIVLPGMILTGVYALTKQKKGYFYTAPWLIFSIIMGSSIVVTMILMQKEGYPDTIIPLAMVGSIVFASLLSLLYYLQKFVVSD